MIAWRRVLRLAPLALIAVALTTFLVFRPDREVSLDRLLDLRSALHAMLEGHRGAALCAFVALYVTVVSLSLPLATLLTVTGGFLFGAVTGGLAAACSATLGATLVFLAVRSVFDDVVRQRAAGTIGRIRAGVERGAVSYMLFLRLSPLFPFWLVNVAAACAGVPLRTFAWTTGLGILPITFAFAFAGQNLDEMAQASAGLLAACRTSGETACRAALPASALLSPSLALTLIALSLVALSPVVAKAWIRRRQMDKDRADKDRDSAMRGRRKTAEIVQTDE
jgi:uncharacterized membrane protein YdjX (TVP38/TMEM64 family)